MSHIHNEIASGGSDVKYSRFRSILAQVSKPIIFIYQMAMN